MKEKSFENKNIVNFSKKEINKNNKITIFSSPKTEISVDEKNKLELYIKLKSSTEISNSSYSEILTDYAKNLNISSDLKKLDIKNKKIPLGLSYFLCNENYFKEKIQEGNNYKRESKNYINKNKLVYNKMNLDDFDINKINNILKDIEEIKDVQDARNNKFNIDLNYFNKKSIDLILLPKMENESLNLDNNYLRTNINNYKFYNKKNIYHKFNKNLFESEKKKETNENGKNTKMKNNKSNKQLKIRTGDWYCGFCNNLNFSFRKQCNGCGLSKFYWL